MFVDLPDAEENAALWIAMKKRFGIAPKTPTPQSEDWTGAEIEACCEQAARFNKSLIEVAANIVPICKSAPDKIESLRNTCAGRFKSASHSGMYKMPMPTTSGKKRNLATSGI
jgi:hypothetical protein